MFHRLVVDDCRKALAKEPDQSVQCVVTSPPYWGLRDYKLEPSVWGGEVECEHEWGEEQEPKRRRHDSDIANSPKQQTQAASVTKEGGGNFCQSCGAWRGCLGLEPTPDLYVAHLVSIFREVKRVLRDDGTVWLNLGSSYARDERKGQHKPGDAGKQNYIIERGGGRAASGLRLRRARACDSGGTARTVSSEMAWSDYTTRLKHKDLVPIPWMVAMALQMDGWYLRGDQIWAKGYSFHPTTAGSCMPESVTDRPTRGHEFLFLLSKSAQYYYDADAVKERGISPAGTRAAKGSGTREGNRRQPPKQDRVGRRTYTSFNERYFSPDNPNGYAIYSGTRNLRSVWLINPKPFKEAHFACVDYETEALTPTGWKYIQGLTDGDTIAAYSPKARQVVWEAATFTTYDDAPLIGYEKRDLSMRVTPNHRCLVLRRSGNKYETRTVEADSLTSRDHILQSAPFGPSPYETGSIGASMAALVGWYITEGTRRGKVVCLYQSLARNRDKVDLIRALLVDVGADFTERVQRRTWRGRPADMVTFSVRGTVAVRLIELAPAKSLTIPLVHLPAAEAHALWRALILGDGHTRRDGRSSFIQKDEACTDLAQMLGCRLGLRTVKRRRKEGTFVVYFTSGEWLTLRGTNGRTASPQPFGRGPVWCPSVPSSYWLARRRGTTFITGNTFPPALVEPCIKAGSKLGDVVLDPFAGSGTVALVSEQLGRNSLNCEPNPEYAALAFNRLFNLDIEMLVEGA